MNQKDTILLTAFKMFAMNGYDGVSLNNIIKESGLTKGGVYYHFSSKDELFQEVVQAFVINYYTHKIKDIVTNNKKSVRRRIYDCYCIPAVLLKEAEELFPLESNGFAFYLMFDGLRKFDSMKQALSDCYKEVTELIISLLKEGITKQEIKEDINVKSLSIEIVSLLDGVQMYTSLVPDMDLEKLLKSFFQRTWKSIKI